MDKRKNILITVLVILLVLAVGYIVVGSYIGWKQNQNIEIYQQGAQYGYEQAIIQVAQLAVVCEPVPLRIENQTINVVSVDCLE